MSLPKIFVFCNVCMPDRHTFVAIAEDGHVLAGHVCSSHSWAYHDMGVNENGWKRDTYSKHYPDGFEVEYIETKTKSDVDNHPGLSAAFEKNAALAQETK